MAGGFLQKIKDAGAAQLAKMEGQSSSNQQQQQQQQQQYQPPPSQQWQQPLAPNQHSAPQMPIGSHTNGAEKMNIAYFTNWSIYGQKYLVSKIPAQSLTHVLYAFADVKSNGEVFLTDKWADVEASPMVNDKDKNDLLMRRIEQIHYEGDSWNDSGKNLYGCFKQLLLLKKQHRHLKLLLSIGGWTFSSHFSAVNTAAGRSMFVSSAMKLLEDVGLDGLDIDWEYPHNQDEAHQYVQLLAELRQALNARSHAVQGRHWLSIAAPCGEQMKILDVRGMDQYLDMWNLMAYDFSGTWSDRATHQANLFSSSITAASVDESIQFYTSQGVHPAKLIVGMPLYARAFAKTDGLGSKFNGVPQGGAEPGNFYYNDLPLPGHSEQFDSQAIATFSQNAQRREIASYDGPQSVDHKINYVQQRGLAGTMWWELSGDCNAEKGGMDRSLIPRAAQGLGKLDSTSNNLHYPHSQYDNVRRGI